MSKEGNDTPIKSYLGYSRKRFQRTVSRSNSSVSCNGSRCKELHRQKSNISVGTYIKPQKAVGEDQENRASRISQDRDCEKNIENNSKVGVPDAKHRLDCVGNGERHDSYRYARNSSKLANGRDLRMIEDLLQKERKFKKQLQKKYSLLKQKYSQKTSQCENLEKYLREKDLIIKKMTYNIESLEIDRQETESLWQSNDIFEMVRIKKDQQIRELILFRQTDEKTILRLTSQIAQFRQPRVTPKKLRKCESMDTLNQSGFSSIDDSYKQQEISMLPEESKVFNFKNSISEEKLAEEKRKMTDQYQLKFGGFSSNYQNAQKQLSIFSTQGSCSQEFWQSLNSKN